MRVSAIVFATSVILALASNVGAQTEDFGRKGAYVGGGFVYGFENFDFDEVSNATGIDFDASGSPGVDVRGGYRFNEFFALEGNFDYYANFGIEENGIDAFSATAFSFFANAKGYPLSGRVQPYGLFGLGVLAAQIEDDFGFDVSETAATFALRAGAGLDVYVTEKILVNLDVGYVFATSDMNFDGLDVGTDLIPLAITCQFRF